MKRSNLLPVLSVLCILGLFSCAHDESITEQMNSFTVKIQTEAFAPHASTRIPTEEGYKTVFKGGEQIGITAVKGGVIYHGMDNVPFTYDATVGTWKLSNNTLPQLYYYPDVTFIAYYPYDAAMSGKKSEQEIIDAFTPQTDQSTYAAYTASDLMTGEASVTGSDGAYTLTFDLKHRMTLMIIYPRGQHYQSSDGYDFYAPPKEISTFQVRSTTAAYEPGDCTYRAIVAPGAVDVAMDYVTMEDAALQYKGKVTAEAGKYHEVLLAPHNPALPYTISPGDYFFVDGGLLPHDVATLSETNKKYCVGIVFYVGQHPTDDSAYTTIGGNPMSIINGYVVSLDNLGWQNGIGGWILDRNPVEGLYVVGTSTALDDYKGYGNTHLIKSTAETRGAWNTSVFHLPYRVLNEFNVMPIRNNTYIY